MSLLTKNPDGRLQARKFMYYTGKNINATAGSRSAYAVDIVPGMVLQEDPYNQDGYGLQQTVALPTAGVLTPLYSVVEVPKGSERGGNLIVVPVDMAEDALVNGSVTVGSYLQVSSTTAKFVQGVGTTVAHMLALVGSANSARPIFVALEANSSGDKLIKVAPAFGNGF